MPAKMAQISPLGRRSGCQDYGRRPRRQAVLSKRGNSAKIHPGLGFIWGIPDYTCVLFVWRLNPVLKKPCKWTNSALNLPSYHLSAPPNRLRA